MPAQQAHPRSPIAPLRREPGQGLSRVAGVIMLMLLSSCAVGPDFQRPGTPTVDGYGPEPPLTETAAAPTAHGTAQRLAPGRDIPGEWWALFRSTPLNSLIAEALKNSPNVAAAEAVLRQAHELTLAGEGAFFPTAQAGFAASRNKTSGSLSPATASGSLYFSQYSAQLGVSYVPDVFGGTRRQVESLAAQEEAQRFQLEAAYLTLTANLVAAAVTEASLRGQIAAAEEIIRIQRDSLTILRRQFGLGQVAGQEVAAVETALAQAEASLPPLHKQLGQQRHLIAVLAGRLPADEPQARFDLAGLQLPQEVPLSLPSKLVDQRPDVRAAEASLHAASAQVGVAVAAR